MNCNCCRQQYSREKYPDLISGISKFQSLYRAHKTRQEIINATRKAYENIVDSIETEIDEDSLQWKKKHTICLPTLLFDNKDDCPVRKAFKSDYTYKCVDSQTQNVSHEDNNLKNNNDDYDSVHDENELLKCKPSTILRECELPVKLNKEKQSNEAKSEQDKTIDPSNSSSMLNEFSNETENGLLQKREALVMEVLWINQAIKSRKQYLKMKTRLSTNGNHQGVK